MSAASKRRDYSIIGPENKLAYEKGYVAAEWYTSLIPRQRLKELMKRKNGPAIRDTIIWFGSLIITGIIAYLSWGTWWAIPAFFLYGTIYTTAAGSRWHECGHGTAFKTPWMNEFVYQIASFMILFPATAWRWSHVRHHTDTIIIGRDPEIAAPRPPAWRIIVMEIFHLYGGVLDLKKVMIHFFGKLTKVEKEYVPATEMRKVCWEARIWVTIFLAVIAWCIYIGSILPAMFIGLPTLYGFFVTSVLVLTQHLGLHEDVLDHRLNTRTLYLNPILRFLYWNMNYHLEHHMFPMIPYHALPALHEELKADCPRACRSLWEAITEVIHALVKQKSDPAYTIDRPLPSTARPYRYGLDIDREVVSASQ